MQYYELMQKTSYSRKTGISAKKQWRNREQRHSRLTISPEIPLPSKRN